MIGLVPANEETRDEFLRRYGRAMAAWATVERELSTLFWLVTQIKPAMAIKIFYSARSFKERADMFKAAIVAADVSDDVKTISRLLLSKSIKYNECITALENDIPNFDDMGKLLLVEVNAQVQSDEIKRRSTNKGLNTSQLNIVANNFHTLATIIFGFWTDLLLNKAPSPDKFREQLRQLPADARSKDPRPPAGQPKNQARASEG